MSEYNPTPILVTGTHRSGTTWVGKMLAADALTAYISEPLNVLHRPGVFHAKVPCWYQYICEDNQSEYLSAFEELLEFDYRLWDEIRSLRSRKDFLRMGRDFLIFYNGLMRGQRALLKDPFAVFSTAWFAKKLNCKIVITVRHPAAFASSLKRLNWPFDFKDLLNQPLLMRDHLEADREQIQSIQADDVIGQSALLWKLIYRSVHATHELHPDFMIVRHEDLSRDPVPRYRELYSSLGLEFTPRVEKTILNSSSSENPIELSRKKVHAVKLDSRANLKNWKKRLTAEEVDRIREMTAEVSPLYYSDTEW
ncbi:MAG TPA: sulfotransferase [Anaerolineales bacterium]|nr:sulfotransferase [Anaerolineales bacterium]